MMNKTMKAVASGAVLFLGASLLVQSTAGAVEAPGTLAFANATTPGTGGTITDALAVTTSGSCPVGSEGFTIAIAGGNLPIETVSYFNGYAELSSAGTSAGAANAFSVSLSKTLNDIRQDNGLPALATGLYTVTLTCRAGLDPASLKDYVGTLALTTDTTFQTSVPVKTATTAASLTGVARVGRTLSCNAGSWAGATAFTYRFLKNGVVAQTSTTKSTLTLVASDLGKTVRCTVTASNVLGSSSAIATSSVKVALGAAPVATTKPRIVYSGTPTVGKLFTAYRGVWSPKATYSFTYIWKRGTTIVKQGATATSYRTTSLDRGKTITLTVKAKRTGYATGTAVSAGVRVR